MALTRASFDGDPEDALTQQTNPGAAPAFGVGREHDEMNVRQGASGDSHGNSGHSAGAGGHAGPGANTATGAAPGNSEGTGAAGVPGTHPISGTPLPRGNVPGRVVRRTTRG